MSDIVDELRERSEGDPDCFESRAAAEIKRLRALVEKNYWLVNPYTVSEEFERLRTLVTAADELRARIITSCEQSRVPYTTYFNEALRAYDRARAALEQVK